MARVVVSPTARADLETLINTQRLPRDARSRVRDRLGQLADFPHLGPELSGRWEGYRFLVGPWRWMLIVYRFEEEAEQVSVLTIQDARSAVAATSDR